MFQKVGLLDILIGLWHRKMQIILILCIACILGSAVALVNIGEKNDEPKAETYSKSIVLYVDTTKKTEGVDLISQAQKIRATYLSLYDSALFSEYLQAVVGDANNIRLGDYLIPVKTASATSDAIPDKNIRDIYLSVTVSGPSSASTLLISFACTDLSVGDQVLDAIYSYAEEELQEKIAFSTVSEIGRSHYVVPAEEVKAITLTDAVKACVKNAIVYCVVFLFVFLIAAVFVMLFRPVINRENDVREYGDFPVFTLPKAGSKDKVSPETVSFVRYIVSNFEGKYLGFAGCDGRDVRKNKIVADVYRILNKLGKKAILVNFDPDFASDIAYIDAVADSCSDCYEYSYDFESASVKDYDLVLVNYCSVSDRGYLLSPNLPAKDLVLDVNFGKTTYRNAEKSMNILKQNKINLFAVLGTK